MPDQQYRLDPAKFHATREKELNKTTTFKQLWPVYDI